MSRKVAQFNQDDGSEHYDNHAIFKVEYYLWNFETKSFGEKITVKDEAEWGKVVKDSMDRKTPLAIANSAYSGSLYAVAEQAQVYIKSKEQLPSYPIILLEGAVDTTISWYYREFRARKTHPDSFLLAKLSVNGQKVNILENDIFIQAENLEQAAREINIKLQSVGSEHFQPDEKVDEGSPALQDPFTLLSMVLSRSGSKLSGQAQEVLSQIKQNLQEPLKGQIEKQEKGIVTLLQNVIEASEFGPVKVGQFIIQRNENDVITVSDETLNDTSTVSEEKSDESLPKIRVTFNSSGIAPPSIEVAHQVQRLGSVLAKVNAEVTAINGGVDRGNGIMAMLMLAAGGKPVPMGLPSSEGVTNEPEEVEQWVKSWLNDTSLASTNVKKLVQCTPWVFFGKPAEPFEIMKRTQEIMSIIYPSVDERKKGMDQCDVFVVTAPGPATDAELVTMLRDIYSRLVHNAKVAAGELLVHKPVSVPLCVSIDEISGAGPQITRDFYQNLVKNFGDHTMIHDGEEIFVRDYLWQHHLTFASAENLPQALERTINVCIEARLSQNQKERVQTGFQHASGSLFGVVSPHSEPQSLSVAPVSTLSFNK